jgi:hypothetical protein
MQVRRLIFSCLLAVMLLIAASDLVRADQTPAQATAATTSSDLDSLGKGLIPLDGPWKFHLGDNPSWSIPGFDDSGWERITAEKSWGLQGHPAYSGFAWYRRHLHISRSHGIKPTYLLLMPRVSDAFEIYWNGALIGQLGKLPPDPSWPASPNPHIFGFPAESSGTLAIRVWAAPLASSASGNSGGLLGPPLIGDAASIEGSMALRDYDWLRSVLYPVGLNFHYLIAACVALVMWLRRREERLLLWFAIFASTPAIWGMVYELRLPVSALVASSVLQPLFALRDISLWFLLLLLLQLDSHDKLARWAKALTVVILVSSVLDAILEWAYFLVGWNDHLWIDWTDAILTAITTVVEVFPLIIVALGIRRKLDPARWALASAAFLSQMILVTVAASQQGERFTHWTFAFILSATLFSVGGMYFNAQILADTALFISILYTVYRYSSENRRRQAILEQEFKSARELQQVLVPESLPSLPGFALTSAYRPAPEVGGDFFQIIPLNAGSTLVVFGDVSGKGLRAAMAVSLILGAARMAAEFTSSPAEILAGLNRRLFGRLQGGFTTCLAMRLEPDGHCTIASAGHPSPFLNDHELSLSGALPLGVVHAATYQESAFRLQVGDHLALYTDGLLEARNSAEELYGFERLAALFDARPTAAEASDAAVSFGQDDDITVLTFTRVVTA